ncbi:MULTISPECIES: hypothetical protein [Flavobacterium]|jgi:hypothetical protein|uniref:Uncharacterized protein n=3 Tax=Flavobacterium TaxID=237 RepID=A0A7W7IWA0_9FLAO|nr:MULTISPECIES: hypothetical protein [Flavobacterium]MBB4801756.1 hypothetical protein [Flavobacterium nitrogenifigens]MBB6386714.1 hypothetical protein [Flavobacterium notoginsengisoli]MBW1655959.1 hypothetical protein [Flavobacterium quisquiliarum]
MDAAKQDKSSASGIKKEAKLSISARLKQQHSIHPRKLGFFKVMPFISAFGLFA